MSDQRLEPWQVELRDAATAAEVDLRALVREALEKVHAAEIALRDAGLRLVQVGRVADSSIEYQLRVAREALHAAEALAARPAPAAYDG